MTRSVRTPRKAKAAQQDASPLPLTQRETERLELEQLIARCGRGDEGAFSELYDRTSAKLYGVALRILKDRGAAEDALQETYFNVWGAAGRFSTDGASPITWLVTIARHRAIDRLRRSRHGDNVPIGAAALAVPTAAPGPEAQAAASSERRRVEACMGELPKDRAALVRAVYLDGDSYAQLAARHKVPINTMRSWMRRALISLRACLAR